MNGNKVTPLRFLHIPKCGGQTFNYVLSRQYDRKHTFAFSGDAKGDLARYGQLDHLHGSFELFRGHAPIETEVAEANAAVTITMFRDPVSRVKSFCQHVSEGKSAHLFEQSFLDAFDLDAFLESGVEELSNLQTKMMINTGSCHGSELIDALGDTAAVDLAIRNLHERVVVFGLVERYDESLIHFAEFLGWSLPAYARKNTKSPTKRLSFDARHLEKIRELNRADIALYERVKSIYQDRYEMNPQKIKQLRRQQFLSNYILPRCETLRLWLIKAVRLMRK